MSERKQLIKATKHPVLVATCSKQNDVITVNTFSVQVNKQKRIVRFTNAKFFKKITA
jgi:hypothetical protein